MVEESPPEEVPRPSPGDVLLRDAERWLEDQHD